MRGRKSKPRDLAGDRGPLRTLFASSHEFGELLVSVYDDPTETNRRVDQPNDAVQ